MALFRRLGVPDADSLNGDELDWMFDSSSKEQESLLEFLTAPKLGHLSADKNVLTKQELESWAEMQKTCPKIILSGPLLDQAASKLQEEQEDADLEALSDEQLEKMVAEGKEQLKLEELELEQVQHLKSVIGKTKTTLAMDLSKTGDLQKKLEAEILAKQQRMLHIDHKYQSSVQDLSQAVQDIQNILKNDFQSNKHTTTTNNP